MLIVVKIKMGQINIHIDKATEELISYLSDRNKIPKFIYARNLLMENLKEKALPVIMKDFEAGKIGFKKIMRILMLNPEELLQIISNANIQCPITPELDEYTIEVTQKMREDRKKGKISTLQS